ncbi:MAG: helix-turn-helix domain-containing protein [Chitinophagaceae bacterium]
MQHPDTSNVMFQLATELVCGTNATIFLTGKAGTGKTTFLKHIKEITQKNIAVVAPTGVAAINAGGTTIHSFFQLPFTPFVPAAAADDSDATVNPHTLLGRMRLTTDRRQVLRQLELLVIDEISMVRADTLDAIDLVLRHFRFRYAEPFGGVQVLMIGDMYQIPPVIRGQEWQLLSQFYRSGYFFDSRVVQQVQPVHVAFTKIYRQQDQRFVQLLNQVRNNELDSQGIELLQGRYQPGFNALGANDCIILTTHNAKADEINATRMNALASKKFFFEAAVEGEFAEKSYPAEAQLVLKEGAQVMFIKNDTERVRRYYNGKIGTVSQIEEDKIWVRVADSELPIEVKKEKWDNIRYGLNSSSQQVEEDVVGSFTQYPLRLAWAVTIHKSQGLTFEKAVIDAGEAFSPGQVYVALSRCTSLEGVVLLSKIPIHSLANDQRIVQFSNEEQAPENIQSLLHTARHQYQASLLQQLFDVSGIVQGGLALQQFVLMQALQFNPDLLASLEHLLSAMQTLQETAQKFTGQRNRLFNDALYPENNPELQARVSSAAIYFQSESDKLLQSMRTLGAVTESRQYAKEYNDLYRELYLLVSQKMHLVSSCANGFKVVDYYTAKNGFKAPLIFVNAYATGSAPSSSQTAHPVLHRKLKQVRDAICEESGLPIYLVASGKTLEELAELLPQDKDELQSVSGFGKVKAEKYGSRFLKEIVAYCEAEGLESNIGSKIRKQKSKTPASTTKVPSATQTLTFFRQGMTIGDIARERKVAPATIQEHLTQFIASGKVSILELTDPEKVDAILNALKETGISSLGAVKAKLGDEYSFSDIRAVVQHFRFLQQEEPS